MADWISQYTSALDTRDAREQAHKPFIDAYASLADRTASVPEQSPKAASPSPTPSKQRAGTPTKKYANPATTAVSTDLIATLRVDLVATQKARSTLQTQLDDVTLQLSTFSKEHKTSQAQIAILTRQKLDAERKLRDRDEELKGKGKMVEEVQDEMVAQGLQLSLAEQKSERLEKENLYLVERWMAKVGEEADKVNRESKWE